MIRSLRIFMFMVSMAVSSVLFAQSGKIIKGIVVDSISGAPESFATVYLFPGAQKTNPLQSTFTNEQGIFQFKPVKAGSYRVTVICIGRKPINRQIKLSDKDLQLDTLRLSDDANKLGAVTVTAQKPLIKAEVDKISYQISEDPEAKTNSTLEMLRKVPMVTVDGEDNIQVNGSSSFKVYVNGKPNQMMSSNPTEIFKTYPASVIKKIEVITNPGARYDAEGVAGVLNIITEGDTRTTGYSLTPSFNYNTNGYRGSLFGMTQVGKLMLSAHYGVGHDKRPASIDRSEREVFNEDINHLLTSYGSERHTGTFHFGSLEGSYEFDEKNLLSVSAGLHGHSAKENGYETYEMFSRDNNPVYKYTNLSSGKHSRFGVNASADYQHSFRREGEAITLSYRMNLNPSSEKSYNNFDFTELPFALTDLFYDTRNHSDEHTFQIDYTTPLDSIQTLSAGLKYIYRINKSDNEERNRVSGSADDYQLDEMASLLYRHRGDIWASYLEYGLSLGKLSAKAGARYEYYTIDVTYPRTKDPERKPFDKHLGDLVPSVSLGYNLTETKMLKLGYNMRIGRPSINSLSPYQSHPTPEVLSYGNPSLTSEHAHNIEAGFSTFSLNFNLNATLTYSVSTDGITSYSFIRDNIVNTTSDNFMHRKSWGLNVFLRTNLTKTTTLNANLSGRYTDYKINQIQNHNSGWSMHAFGGLQQKLPWKLKIGLWGGGATPETNLQGRGSKFYFYSLNLSRSFLKEDRMEITLQANNFIGRYHYFTDRTVTADYSSVRSRRADFMRLGVGIRYRFGSLKAQVKKAKRTISNDDTISEGSSSESQSQGGDSGQ